MRPTHNVCCNLPQTRRNARQTSRRTLGSVESENTRSKLFIDRPPVANEAYCSAKHGDMTSRTECDCIVTGSGRAGSVAGRRSIARARIGLLSMTNDRRSTQGQSPGAPKIHALTSEFSDGESGSGESLHTFDKTHLNRHRHSPHSCHAAAGRLWVRSSATVGAGPFLAQ